MHDVPAPGAADNDFRAAMLTAILSRGQVRALEAVARRNGCDADATVAEAVREFLQRRSSNGKESRR